jgi:hypothetical protein
VDGLLAARQYEGRKWLSSDYLSVEPVEGAPGQLLVTVRETWVDYLVSYSGEDPFAWWRLGLDQPIAAERGPYSVDVAYVLAPEPFTCEASSYLLPLAGVGGMN